MNARQSVDLSRSEIASLVSRAARGAGFEWGEADEAATAAIWLARAGLDWATPLLKVFSETDLVSPKPSEQCWPASGRQCPIKTGIALGDFATLNEGPASRQLTILHVFQPIILLPFAERAAVSCEAIIEVTFQDHSFVVSPTGGQMIQAFNQSDACADVVIRLGGVRSVSMGDTQEQDSAVLVHQYDELNVLAMNTTVPTSARSQAGAGEANTDPET